MKIIEEAKALISNGKIQNATENFVFDSAGAVLGDPVSIGKIILAVAKSPFFWREQIFWTKMEMFINGVYYNENDRAKLRARLCQIGEENKNVYRLVDFIDKAESKQKIKYLINATRCLLTDFIDLQMYFRICHTITHTMEEDLNFLSKNIDKADLSYNTYIQGLLTSGLVYQSVIGGNCDSKYSFTPLAESVDRFAVSYDDVERYPNPIQIIYNNRSPQTQLSGIPEWEEIPESDIKKMF